MYRSGLLKRKKRLLSVLIAAVFLIVSSTSVFAVTAPNISVTAPICYRNLIYDGDIYCQSIYQLPTFTTSSPPPANPEAWSQYLADQTGTSLATGLTTGARVDPVEATSLLTDHAFVQVYRNYSAGVGTLPAASSILENTRRIARVDYALTGLYMSTGNALTWGDTSTALCVISSDDPAIFTVQSGDCELVQWNSASSDQESQRAQLGLDTLNNLLTLESLRSVSNNSYVVGEKISSSGRIFVLEALAVMDEVIPGYFQASGGQSITTPYETPTGSNALQTNLDTDAATTGLPLAFTNMGNNVFGISGGAMATIIFVFFGLLIFIILFSFTKEPIIPTTGLLTMLMIGAFVRGPTVSVLGVLIVVLSLIAAMFIMRKWAS